MSVNGNGGFETSTSGITVAVPADAVFCEIRLDGI